MERLFPRALLACIGEGRSPQQHELATIADKVWHEAFRQCAEAHELAMNIAHAALSGEGRGRILNPA